jgi:pyruvate/2-oxoacid:ferredoxin oxidoreductase alpha subunit
MSTINEINTKIDQTVRVFDSFYNFEVDVPVNEYDVVFAFFKSIFTTAQAAGNFTVTLFRIADETNTSVLTLLQELEGQNQIQITATLAYYLNNLRSPATLLGYSVPVTPNFYAARNVRA